MGGVRHGALAKLEMGEPRELGFCPERLRHLAEALNEEVATNRIPGAVTLIGRHGKIAFWNAVGVADPETGEPMRPDTIFRIFSMTKPVTSVAIMILMERGLLSLNDPLSNYIQSFASPRVATFEDGRMRLSPASRAISIHHLLTHTAGISHETVPSPLQALYSEQCLMRRDRTNEQHAEAVATLPLLCEPGTQWNYSRSVELLGRVIEIVSGVSLSTFLRTKIFEPLGMHDTGFHIDAIRTAGRSAEPFRFDPSTGEPIELFDMRTKPAFEAGGGGLVSTALDYSYFAQMLMNGGVASGRRILSSRTVKFMTSNHLDGTISRGDDILPQGYGFGLGFAVRLGNGLATSPGAMGQIFWNGSAGTQFWIDPTENLWALLMVQAPKQRDRLKALIRNLVYAALDD